MASIILGGVMIPSLLYCEVKGQWPPEPLAPKSAEILNQRLN